MDFKNDLTQNILPFWLNNAIDYENNVDGKGYAELPINFVAPIGMVTVNSISNYNELGSVLTSIRQGVVEDIIDTGRTLKTVTRLMWEKGASDVKIITLLDKPERRTVEIEADYVGFTIPNEFVIGYGLDFNQKYRNLPYVGILKEECYK